MIFIYSSMVISLWIRYGSNWSGKLSNIRKREIAIEKKLNHTIEKQQQFEHVSFDGQSYSQAASLVDCGADVDQLVESCGLPRAEAQLMTLLKKAN